MKNENTEPDGKIPAKYWLYGAALTCAAVLTLPWCVPAFVLAALAYAAADDLRAGQ